MFSDELQESNEAQSSGDEVVMEVELDEDDELPYVHGVSGKCNACTHLLHSIPPTAETCGPWSFFKIYLCIIYRFR